MSLKIKLMSLFTFASLLLVGCGDKSETVATIASTSNDEEYSVYELEVLPPSVRNEIISEDVYFDIKHLIDETEGYVDKLTEYQTKVNQDKSILYDERFVDEYMNTIDGFTKLLENVHIDPQTDVDSELEQKLPEILEHGLKANNSLKLFVETREFTYFENYQQHFDNYSTKYLTFTEKFFEYGTSE